MTLQMNNGNDLSHCSHRKTQGRKDAPGKITGWCWTGYSGWITVEHNGDSFQSVTVRDKVSMLVLQNGETMVSGSVFFLNWIRKLILRISVLIRRTLRFMRALMVEKRENKAIGLTKGGLNTKIHAIVDGLGNPVAFLLSPGNDGDSTHAIELMNKTDITGSNLLAEKAYGTKERQR